LVKLEVALSVFGLFSGFLLFWKNKGLPRIKFREAKSVSVIVPARNEEKNLPKLLKSLSKQVFKPLEVIIVDDLSEDATSEVANGFGAKVISITDIEEGWLGKPWACYNGYLNSKGEILIFSDADVKFSYDAIKKIVATLVENSGVVSVWPYYYIKKFYENLSLLFAILAALSSKSFSFFSNKTYPSGLYGPCFAVSRIDYEAISGHKCVKNAVVEDYRIGRVFVKNGIKVSNFLGNSDVIFRMYPDGLKSLILGWAKNSALGLNVVDLSVVIPILLWLLGAIIPFLNFSRSDMFSLLYLAFIFQYLLFSRRVGNFSLICSVFYPVFIAFFLLILALSFYKTFVRGVVEWKDREIQTKKSD
jgi:glycosyltransferase involved in cell wall biosynthesis